jgi:hypothetical protein
VLQMYRYEIKINVLYKLHDEMLISWITLHVLLCNVILFDCCSNVNKHLYQKYPSCCLASVLKIFKCEVNVTILYKNI